MTVKVASSGLFTIPTAPSVGTATAQSSVANTYGAFVTQQASGTLGALYITGVSVSVVTSSSLHTGQYCDVQLATGASGSETVVGAVKIPTPGIVPAASAKYGGYRDFDVYPIAVAANTRIAAKTASDTANAIVWNVSLKAILQANVVADTNANETVNVIQFNGTNVTARDIGASVLLSSGTGAGQVSLVSGTVALSSTAPVFVSSGTGAGQLNVTAGVVDANTTKVSGTSQTARDLGASVLLSSGTGTGQVSLVSGTVVLSSTAPVFVSSGTGTGQLSVSAGVLAATSGDTTLLSRWSSAKADNLDATVSSRAASTDVTAIKAKTDSLTFGVANQVDTNIKSVVGVTITGTGTLADPWGP